MSRVYDPRGMRDRTPLPGSRSGSLVITRSLAPRPRNGAVSADDPQAIADGLGPGAPLAGGVRSSMESVFGRSFAHVRVHTGADAAAMSNELDARAFAVGEHVAFGAGEYRPGTPVGDVLLAHELAHVEQHAAAPNAAPRLQRCSRARRRPELESMTYDEMIVERARRALPILETYVDEWRAREMRRSREPATRAAMLASRRAIEDPMAEATMRPEEELREMAAMNRRPLRIEVTEDEVIFHARFHARFEDPARVGDFGRLRTALQDGARLVWDRHLERAMAGKRFRLVPEVTRVEMGAERDRDFWLITVRPTDESPVTYPGCALDDPGDLVAAVTNASCDGGIISLPPSLVGNDFVLGHEILHLFGMFDRYRIEEHVPDVGAPFTVTVPTRDTGTRDDPLGNRRGPILEEDVALLFDQLDVYDIEANRGLATLRRLEAEGWTLPQAEREIVRLRDIISAGRDPRSLLPIRRDFNEEIRRSAEEL